MGRRDSISLYLLRKNVVIILLLVSFTPLVLIGGILYYKYSASLREETLKRLRSKVESHKELIDLFLFERLTELRALAEARSFHELSSEEGLKELFYSWQSEHRAYSGINVVDRDGNPVARLGRGSLEAGDFKDQKWFKETVAKGEYIDDVSLEPDGFLRMVAAVLRQEGGREWVLRATVDLERFSSLVQKMSFGRTGEAFITDEGGRFLTSTRLGGRRSEIGIRHERGGENGEIKLEEHLDYRGINVLCAHWWIRDSDWALVVKQDKDEVFAPVYSARNIALGIFGAGGLAIVITVVMIATRLVDLERQLIQSHKLASVGTFAAGLAHEIRNPLNSAGIQLLLLERRILKEAEGEHRDESLRLINVVREEIGRLDKLVGEFLVFSKPMVLNRSRVDVHAILDEILDLYSAQTQQAGVEIERRYCNDLHPLLVDKERLKQALINVIQNAIEAMPNGGKLTVATDGRDRHVQIRVVDTGVGIPDSEQSRLFEIFYSTKEGGTGLGLPITYQIVEAHGGRVSLENEPGRGTTCTIVLPTSW